MSCTCQSGCRQLLVFAPDLANRYPELMQFEPGESWAPMPEQGAVCVTIGPGYAWHSVREVVNFLRSVLDEPRARELTASWLDSCGSVRDQMSSLADRERVTDMAPMDSTQISDILFNRRIETWYQPVVNARSHELWGYECLMRGRGDDGETIDPGTLIHWAKQEQLTFMLDRVCRERHLLNASEADIPDHVHLLINFLPTTVYDPNFCLQTTVQAAKQAQIHPSRIVFEVVESEHVEDREHLLSILAFYRNAGFSVALDDVGAGYAGLMLLAEMNPDLVKIDRGLVTRAPESNMHQGICRSLIEIAREANKLSLAEGVETDQERRLMESLGVDLIQGYLFGRPSPEPAYSTAVGEQYVG